MTTGPGEDVDVPIGPGHPHRWRTAVIDRWAESPRYRWLVLTASLIGLFSVGFSITVLAVSVPTIAEDLGAPRSLITWVITGPLLAYAVFGPSAGKLADILGARRVYLMSLAAVGVFAALSAVAWSGGSLVGFRTAGAAVGAAVGPASLAMINRLFPPFERARALGFWSMVAAGGPVLGVIIGGPVVEAFSWRWIFVAQVPLTAAALLFGWLVLPDVARRRNVSFDVPGSVLLALAASSLLLGLNRGPVDGWAAPLVIGCLVAAPVFVVAFVAVERSRHDPLLPLRYVRQRNFAAPVANQFFLNFAYMGGFIITPLLLQDVLGYGEARTGFLSIARPLAFTLAGPLAGYAVVRVGERFNALVGGLAIVVSMVGLAAVTGASTDLYIVAVLAASGIGMGMAGPAMTATLANSVDEGDLGVATAFQQMCNHIGTVVGTQVMITVQLALAPVANAPGTGDELAWSYHVAYLVGGGAAVLGVVAALFVRRSKRMGDVRPPRRAGHDAVIDTADGAVHGGTAPSGVAVVTS
jgi:EmrB/QacA subfamily drug resistance transporter